MKIGKFISLGAINNVKVGYGTIDNKNLKTVYLKFNTWLEPKNEASYDKESIKRRRKIINFINHFNFEGLFKNEVIVDLDMKTKGMKLEKRSFMNLEVTLFVNQQFNIREKYVMNKIKQLSENIIFECLVCEDFDFTLTKNPSLT